MNSRLSKSEHTGKPTAGKLVEEENLILVLDICNGFLNYLPRKEEFTRNTYQVKIALFGPESEEIVRAKVVYLINKILNIN